MASAKIQTYRRKSDGKVYRGFRAPGAVAVSDGKDGFLQANVGDYLLGFRGNEPLVLKPHEFDEQFEQVTE